MLVSYGPNEREGCTQKHGMAIVIRGFTQLACWTPSVTRPWVLHRGQQNTAWTPQKLSLDVGGRREASYHPPSHEAQPQSYAQGTSTMEEWLAGSELRIQRRPHVGWVSKEWHHPKWTRGGREEGLTERGSSVSANTSTNSPIWSEPSSEIQGFSSGPVRAMELQRNQGRCPMGRSRGPFPGLWRRGQEAQ